MKSYSLTKKNKDLLLSRFVHNLTDEEKLKFKDCPKLFGTNLEVNKYNYKKMIELKRPIFKINSENYNKACSRENDEVFFGLKKTLYLCNGAKVFISQNLNTSLGLYNSSPGTVVDIVYAEDANHE